MDRRTTIDFDSEDLDDYDSSSDNYEDEILTSDNLRSMETVPSNPKNSQGNPKI